MRIIAWNLNHRTREKRIPAEVGHFLESYSPDVVTLNEYVDGPSRESFYRELRDLGYSHIELSEPTAGNNQILACSKKPMVRGSLPSPKYDSAAFSNFLHVSLPESELDIVGIRAPAYNSRIKKEAYWREIAEIAAESKAKRMILLGDLNYDPFVGIARSVPKVGFSFHSDYYIPNPVGDWSFISTNGQRSSRIDHAIASESLEIAEAEYIAEWNSIVLAGPSDKAPVTDHAVLSIRLERMGTNLDRRTLLQNI
ncbi:endonuclease/exonuclease/phosphatase family protein [Marinobacter sp. JSM 1782161]|uniref:endonuclease/exonuclease/phosphatase family protein n=1 Tax=Marinobacter sp. JSM 1782161 TaxID=2685906 RepID=UPI0014033D62|nr:endonuclease/exonuclease/phosphatase family protein [Marinobacter sp. JSM 1782161]